MHSRGIVLVSLLLFGAASTFALVIPSHSHIRSPDHLDRHRKHADEGRRSVRRCDPDKMVNGKCPENDRPIVGIVAEEVGENETATLKLPTGSSFVAASYVKWVESGGARVVPILINQTQEYYHRILSSVNGVVFPGGAVSLDVSGYARAGKIIYDAARKMNANGTYFPLWGTCLGFELLTVLAANHSWLTYCKSENISLPVDFLPGFRESKLFGNAPDYVVKLMQKPLTSNSHHFCITPGDFEKAGLNKSMRMLGTSTDTNGTRFLAAVEDRTYPFYGVQFHPEKSNFEWRHPSAFSHGAEAVLLSQYFANFFVAEARQNFHQFSTRKEEDDHLIYNWNPIFSRDTVYDQMYIFSL